MAYLRYLFGIVFLLQLTISFSQTDSVPSTRPRIGLVLSGGGAKGFAHIGVLKVLEEIGIRPDYITGTSMGGIIGAFYALGFSADSIEKIVTSQDWEYLLSDQISRRDLAIHDKEMSDRYFLSFPVRKKKLELPSGIVSGQRILNLFTEYTVPFHDSSNFLNFPIPFQCIATDIETGNYVVLNKGYLPEALRATMSIPSVFKPLDFQGHLLVDGGLVNNFPVESVIEMGADIVIGVDVQAPFMNRGELNSIVKIVEQTAKFLRAPLNNKNRALCDILIDPDMEQFKISSFSNVDSIIMEGEKAARAILPKLKHLYNSLNNKYPGEMKTIHPVSGADHVYIQDVTVEGLSHVTRQMVLGKLNLKFPGNYSIFQITDAVNRVYASRFFDLINFKIHQEGNRKILVIKVLENTTDYLNVGVHYDTDFNASLLLNASFHNVYKNGSLAVIEARLSENPRFMGSFFIDKGWKPGPLVKFEATNFEVYEYQNEKRTASFNYSLMTLDIGFQSSFFKNASLSWGIQGQISSKSEKISPVNYEGIDHRSINYFGQFKVDTYDRLYYPNRGTMISLYGRMMTRSIEDYETFDPYSSITLKYSSVIKFSEILVLIPHLYGGFGFGTRIPILSSHYLGGSSNYYIPGAIPFTGMNLMEKQGKNVAAVALDFRIRLAMNHYLTFQSNLGVVADDYKNMLDNSSWNSGLGATYGYNSLIGPVEVSFMIGSTHANPLTYVNIGFWF